MIYIPCPCCCSTTPRLSASRKCATEDSSPAALRKSRLCSAWIRNTDRPLFRQPASLQHPRREWQRHLARRGGQSARGRHNKSFDRAGERQGFAAEADTAGHQRSNSAGTVIVPIQEGGMQSHPSKSRRTPEAGMTLLELIIACTILLVLASRRFPCSATPSCASAKRNSARICGTCATPLTATRI